MSNLDPRLREIFKKGSKTYFNSSLFFPAEVRREVSILYAFVRTADNYVDATPQDGDGFRAFRDEWRAAWHEGKPADNFIIAEFCKLSGEKHFDPAWTEAFLAAMEADLSKHRYDTLDELLVYIYGSAEVIGLFMCAIIGIDPSAHGAARALGRSMQYINFIRDVEEDNQLGRTYLPLGDSGLADLRRETAAAQPEAFLALIEHEAKRFLAWQAEAEKGFRAIPWRQALAIRCASRLYTWTARTILRDPFVIYQKKVKPSKARILFTLISCMFTPRSR